MPNGTKPKLDQTTKTYYKGQMILKMPLSEGGGNLYFTKTDHLEVYFIRIIPIDDNFNTPFNGYYEFINMATYEYQKIIIKNGLIQSKATAKKNSLIKSNSIANDSQVDYAANRAAGSSSLAGFGNIVNSVSSLMSQELLSAIKSLTLAAFGAAMALGVVSVSSISGILGKVVGAGGGLLAGTAGVGSRLAPVLGVAGKGIGVVGGLAGLATSTSLGGDVLSGAITGASLGSFGGLPGTLIGGAIGGIAGGAKYYLMDSPKNKSLSDPDDKQSSSGSINTPSITNVSDEGTQAHLKVLADLLKQAVAALENNGLNATKTSIIPNYQSAQLPTTYDYLTNRG